MTILDKNYGFSYVKINIVLSLQYWYKMASLIQIQINMVQLLLVNCQNF